MIKGILRLPAALLVVNGLLLSAQWLFPPQEGAAWIALEAGFVAGLVLMLPRARWSFGVALGLATVTVLLSFLAFAQVATRLILARPLNLYLDFQLGSSVFDLLAGTLGPPLVILVVAVGGLGIAGAIGLVMYLIWPGEGLYVRQTDRRVLERSRVRSWAARAVGAALMIPVLVWVAIPHLAVAGLPIVSARIGTPAVDLIVAQAFRLRDTLTERDRFEKDLAAAPADYSDVEGLLGRLRGRDVVLAFVESYGIAALDDERYAPVIVPRLRDLGSRMDEAGLSLASGTLVAPTQGGQSWFSHGSLLSGLWLDNQLRYDFMLGSDRETLVDDFRRAGYRTVALMPAITFAWPEGERFHYDEIFARADIPYAGPPLNWVTMPDQFSWSFLERGIRGAKTLASGPDPALPVFVEAGLISSHAPWTPILPVLDDWESIGDGAVFAEWAGAGEPPEELWLDYGRVREHFALSLDYAVAAMISYAERFVDEELLLIVLGDHQPAPLITGEGVSWEVPVHVISGDPELIEPFIEWGFNAGPMPSRDRPDRGMDLFRDWFIHAYSSYD